MADSIELKVVQKLTGDLELALNGPERCFVQFLREKGIINNTISETILSPTSGLNDEQKAHELVQGIEKRIKLDPTSYDILVNDLKNRGAYYELIAKKLDTEYQRQQQSQMGE